MKNVTKILVDIGPLAVFFIFYTRSDLQSAILPFMIATVIAVFIAWYLRKYHNALALYRKDVRKNEKLARGDPDNPAYAIPLASSYRAFAIALTAQNKHAQAAFYNSRADKIEQRLRSFYGDLNKLDQ